MAKKTLILAVILLLGTGLRLVQIDQSLWLDEAAQALMSSRPLTDIWFARPGDFHPPLFYFMAHFWISVSRTDVWLRLLPLVFGVLNILAVYRLSGLLFKSSAKAARLSALLLAIAPFHIYYSQEFRSYSLLSLLATISMVFYLQKHYARAVLVNYLILYTHYSGIFFLLAQLLHLLFYNSKIFRRFFILYALLAALYLPWLPQLYQQLVSGVNLDSYLPGWRQVLSLDPLRSLPTVLFKLTAGRINIFPRLAYGAYIVFILAFVFAALFLTRRARPLIYIWFLSPVLLMILVSPWLPQTQPFRLLFILPALLLSVTQAVLRYPKLMLTLALYISIFGNLAYWTRPRLQREAWRDAISAVSGIHGPSAAVLVRFPAPFAPLEWYPRPFPVYPVSAKLPATAVEVDRVVSGLAPRTSRFVVFDYLFELSDPSREVDRSLTNLGYNQSQILNFEGVGFIRIYDNNRD